jgi:O-antigen/teichoic acid export membrane protein
LYFKQELISDIFLLASTVFFYHYFGLVGIGVASLIQFILYGCYIIPILKNRYDFSIRKDTYQIIIFCFIIGISASAVSFSIDYPDAYYPLGLILVFSIFYSYRELNKRVAIYPYLIKIKDKFKRNE